MSGGPSPIEREQRLRIVRDIADRALAVRGNDVLAIGLYGSTARGTDGPYSDLEIMCVLNTTDEDYSPEWVRGPWKAEVNFLSKNVLIARATKVDERWALTHGLYIHVMPLYDPHNFFVTLREAASAQPEECFTEAIRELFIFNIYEMIGKLRNARHSNNTAYFPEIAISLARYGAYLIGLANRQYYSTSSRLQQESLTLPQRPNGYDDLCRLVMSGDLRNPQHISDLCETFYSGVERWATERGIVFEETRDIPF